MLKRIKFPLAVLIVIICAAIPVILEPTVSWKGERRDFLIKAEQYAYHPHRIVVNRGDEVHIRLAALDVVHGFYLEGYDIEAEIHPGRLPFKLRHPSIEPEFAKVDELVFNADRSGKFRYRCSVTCGTMHPFMLGEFIVRPNYPFLASVGGAVGIFLAAFMLMFLSAKSDSSDKTPAPKEPWRLDLLEVVPGLKWLAKRRWLQFAVVLPNLAFFILFLMAGFLGSPIGNRNIIITIVWILWWFLLITLLLPFGSRIWCLVCPFPFFGEWFQRRQLLGSGPGKPNKGANRMRGLNKKWPQSLSNIWLQNILFLSMCTFSSILATRPVTTAAALGGLAVLATVLHFIYQRRTFCLYICPVSGFLGLYSMASTAEVRCKDTQVCKKCRTKSCMVGSEDGFGAPIN
ncbi:hypothetical protein QUF75_20500 [Desulfococcaceae bacterium HSG7]|nr:hypothetical protein [Desulfococcaceae bacterium HSG7]